MTKLQVRVVLSSATLCLLLSGAMLQAASTQLGTTPLVETLLRKATIAERDNDWQSAWSLTIQALEADPTHDLARRRFHHTLRRMAQLARHNDPKYHAFMESLTPSEALNLYATVLTELGRLYHQADSATPQQLFKLGRDEFLTALSDPEFQRRLVPKDRQNVIPQYQAKLRSRPLESIVTLTLVRQELRGVLLAARGDLGVSSSSVIVGEFICGACRGLDAFGQFLPPGSDVVTPSTLLDSYGIVVAKRAGRWTIDAIRPDSWAAHNSELLPGDELLRFDGQLLSDEARPQSFEDSQLNLSYRGNESGTQTLNRLLLPNPLPSIYGVRLLDGARHIAHLRLAEFNERTVIELESALYSLKMQGMQGLIIDLRGNAGGLLSEAILVAEQFLSGGVIVTVEGQTTIVGTHTFTAEPNVDRVRVPMVVLIDFQTMSSAEMLAQAWKEHRRATLIGQPTFGKGLVQTQVVLSGQGSALVLSIAQLIGPNGQPLNRHGVTPHIIEADPERQLQLAVDKLIELTQE